MRVLKEQSLKGAVAVLISVVRDLGIGIRVEQAINDSQGVRSGLTRVSKGGRECHGESLSGASLETNVGHNLLSFVDGHIFNEEARGSFALA